VKLFLEEISGGAVVTGRIVLLGSGCIQEVARACMTRAVWEDFTRRLGYPRYINPRRIVFAPVTNEPATVGKRRFPTAPMPFVDSEGPAGAATTS
jgi:hypothetical protein